jgi:hypothetical protein
VDAENNLTSLQMQAYVMVDANIVSLVSSSVRSIFKIEINKSAHMKIAPFSWLKRATTLLGRNGLHKVSSGEGENP